MDYGSGPVLVRGVPARTFGSRYLDQIDAELLTNEPAKRMLKEARGSEKYGEKYGCSDYTFLQSSVAAMKP